ncbi:MAG: HlyD family efflux transporter periplasmic adaptor subunit [Hyphomicrobium sp.]
MLGVPWRDRQCVCGTTKAMAVKIKRERPDQRRHHRVTAPLFVRVDGHKLRATDWSLGGLRIDGYPGDLPTAGGELPFHLTLPFQGFDVSFDIKAEVVRTNPAEKMFAVRYTEIGERERELMQHFIEELVRGSMSEVEDTIQRIDVPVTPARLEPDTKKIPDGMPVRRWPVKTVVMTTIYGLAGLVIFGYAGLLGYSNFYRMEIQTAVISAPVETVAAQADGQVQLTGLKPGDSVKAGDVVVNLIDNELERDIELAGIAVKERKAQLIYLKQKHTEELEKLRGFATVEMKNVKQSKVELQGLQDQLKVVQQQHARLKTLYDKGYATESKLDDVEKQVIELKSQIENRRIELTSRVDLAQQNYGKRLYTGQTIEGQSADVEAQVRLAEHEISLAEQRRESYLKQRQRSAVTSPFEGTILEIPRIDRGSVRKGDTLAIIEQRRDRQVTAYLNQDEILKVGLGDEALVYIPALTETVKGRVVSIDRTSGFIREQDQRQSPGYGWRGPHDRSAKIVIDFDEPRKVADDERYRSGLPVVVVFEQRSTNSLLTAIKKKFAVAL